MSELAFTYGIRFSLPKNPQSPASIGAKFVATLDALSRIDPTIFINWNVMDFPAMAQLPLETSRSRIAAIIEKNVERDDWDDPEPDGGYTANGFTADVARSRSIDLRIKAGGRTRVRSTSRPETTKCTRTQQSSPIKCSRPLC
jgi:hypothetical protein